MKNFKFTGVNIAAALLILAYFFPWFTAMGAVSMSGFSVTTNGISPGMMGMFLKGLDRLLMVLIVVVPLSGCIILYQNVTGKHKFGKYYKPAHLVPAAVIIAGLVMLYFKMKPDVPEFSNEDLGGYGEAMKNMSRSMSGMSPGVFDVIGVGVYISLAAAVYLLLVNMGKIKDKEYYTAATASISEDNNTPVTKN